MSINVEEPPAQTSISLVSGILVDLQHLVEQQLRLTRREIEQEFRSRSAAAVIFAIGMAGLFLAAILFSFMFTHLLHWWLSPPMIDPAQIPLWACHGVIASVIALMGGMLAYTGQFRLRATRHDPNPGA